MTTLCGTSAEELFQTLPTERRIRTLSPAYVAADAKRSDDLKPVFFCHREGSAFWLHSFHLSSTPGVAAFDVQSAYGYGGPVSNCDDPGFLGRADEAYCGYCSENAVAAEFVRLHPMAVSWQPFGGDIFFDRDTVVLQLGETAPRAGYSTRARTAVRKAERQGLTIVECSVQEWIGYFAEFYRGSMQEIGAQPFYLFGNAYFDTVSGLDGLRLFSVEQDGRWVSAGLFFYGGDTAEYHLSGTTPEGRRLGATNLLIDHAASVARQEGCRWLYLGGGTNASADNPLFFFKKSFSQLLRPFRIGTRVHRADLYSELRQAHPSKYRTDRILFYRLAS